MEIKEIQINERRTVHISVRTRPSVSKWMAENKISPTALFNKAVEELMNKKK